MPCMTISISVLRYACVIVLPMKEKLKDFIDWNA